MSKVYETKKRLVYTQLYPYFDNIFSKLRCCFRGGYNIQQCILSMIEKIRRFHEEGDDAGAFVTDLSKAFDWFHHDLLMTEPNTHGIESFQFFIFIP